MTIKMLYASREIKCKAEYMLYMLPTGNGFKIFEPQSLSLSLLLEISICAVLIFRFCFFLFLLDSDLVGS